MTGSLKVSIVIPAYNHGTYVGAAIRSVLDQTFQDLELIIINDGSSDNTEEVVLGFSDDRIRYYSQANRGLSATLNRGLSLARGEYFGFLPSDDMYEPEKLARQVAHLDAHPELGVVFSYQALIDAAGAPLRDDEVEAWFRVPHETKEEIFPALFERNFLAAPSVLMRMACFDRVGGFDESLKYAQDYDLWLRTLKYYDIRLLKEPLIRYRWHGGNLTYRATEWTEAERVMVLLKAFRNLQIEDVFPSLRTIHPSERTAGYAEAYEKLAASVERNGLPGLLPMAKIYRTEAERWRLQKDGGLRPRAVTREVDNLAPAYRDIAGKITILMEVRSLDTGGLEEVVFNLARSLDKERFNVLIVCVERGGRVARKCLEHGIPVEVLGSGKEEEYRELLNRHNVNLVCTHYSMFGGPLAAEKEIPLVSVVHNMYVWLPTDVFSEMKTNDRYVSHYVAVSEFVRRYLIGRFNIPVEKVSVIQNGVDVGALAARELEPLMYSRGDFGLAEEDYVLLNVAAITGTKGHNTLIRAMKEVVQKYPRIKVLCVGDTLSEAYADIIKGRVKAWGLEKHILFTDFVDRITDPYRLSDAFVLPSLTEGWSLAVGEAMFFGLPIILTRVGSAETIIDDSDIGKLIEPSYDDAFTLRPENSWSYCVEEEPANVHQLVEAITDFYERRSFWERAANKRQAKIVTHHTLTFAIRQYEDFFIRELFRFTQDKEREYRLRLQFTRALEQIRRRSSEAGTLIDVLWRRLDEMVTLERQNEQRLTALDACLTALDACLQTGLETITGAVTKQFATLEQTQRQRFDSIDHMARLILARLSLTQRIRARRDQVTRALKGLFPYRMRDRVRRALNWLSCTLRLKSHPPGASGLARDRAYLQHVKGIRHRLVESWDSDAERYTALKAIDESRFDRIVIYPPTILWNEHLFQRPQQLFRSLARKGALCFYCSANSEIDHVNGIKQIEPNLYLCSDVSLLKGVDERHEAVLWTTRPDHWIYLDLLPRATVIYEVIDELEVFPFSSGAMERDHVGLLLRAEVVVATSSTLYEKVKRIRGDALLAPNAVRLEDFQVSFGQQGQPVPGDLASVIHLGRPIIGYYGALAEWFDYELLRYAADRCPDYSFVLIGPNHDGTASRLPRATNVFWLGPKRYAELPQYLKYFDVATIPFKVNTITDSVSPIKLFEYMAGRKPIVTTALRECRRYRSVLVAESQEGYVQRLREAVGLQQDAQYLKILDEEAAENTWDARVESIVAAMGRAKDRASRQHSMQMCGGGTGEGRLEGRPNDATSEPGEAARWLEESWGGTARYDIIYFPVNPWSFRLQRTGQLLRQFAKKGHRVFHIDTSFAYNQGDGQATRGFSINIVPLDLNIYQVQLCLGRELNLYRDPLSAHDIQQLSEALALLRQRVQLGDDAVCMVAFPFWAPLAERLRTAYGYKIVYDCMDDHRGFGNIAESILLEEDRLIASSDLLVVSSEVLARQHGPKSRKMVLVKNAADFNHFHTAPSRVPLPEVPRPIIGYYGAIAEWFDAGLIENAARHRPDWSFVLIGHTFGAEIDGLRALPNVHFLGEQPYDALPAYLAQFDVCCIPFRLNDLTRATNPVKFYEYLCSGKPIVSVNLPELQQYKDCVYLADGPEDFAASIERALEEKDEGLANRRVEVARMNTWEERCDSLSSAIEALYPKVSIIVVSYNTISHTRLCLESLLRHTGYPNYEVIVVDNGSTDGSTVLLAGMAWRSPRMTCVFNEANRGFAAGTNQGITAATGDYLVFLNSDTVVTMGWLSGLVRYLQQPTVGLVVR